MSGYIYKIERLAIYDGPGIRTVIFMKGCPLRCLWCTSPESQILKPELGFRQERCTGCLSCIDICPAQANALQPDSLNCGHAGDAKQIDVNRQQCLACGKCVDSCPSNAREMIGNHVTVQDVAGILEKDAPFYHRSGGGITLSGGDPTFQPGFSASILKQAVKMGFHTAMETCAYTPWSALEDIVRNLDLIYVDIKHLDNEEHKRLTGKGNELILENIQRIDERYPETELIIRVPVIPGLNDSESNIRETARFAAHLSRLKRMELLPYHRYGTPYYPITGRTYALNKIPVPTLDLMESLRTIVRSFGVPVHIGG